MIFKPETKAAIRRNVGSFTERLLSTKLMFCGIVFVAINIWLNMKVIGETTYRDLTIAVLAGVLGASLIDLKKPANPDGRILDENGGQKQ